MLYNNEVISSHTSRINEYYNIYSIRNYYNNLKKLKIK